MQITESETKTQGRQVFFFLSGAEFSYWIFFESIWMFPFPNFFSQVLWKNWKIWEKYKKLFAFKILEFFPSGTLNHPKYSEWCSLFSVSPLSLALPKRIEYSWFDLSHRHVSLIRITNSNPLKKKWFESGIWV